MSYLNIQARSVRDDVVCKNYKNFSLTLDAARNKLHLRKLAAVDDKSAKKPCLSAICISRLQF